LKRIGVLTDGVERARAETRRCGACQAEGPRCARVGTGRARVPAVRWDLADLAEGFFE
jgi:hypothetical protein